MKTIFHHVTFPDVLDITTDSYYFCSDETCSVGYFSQQGKTIFKNQLRVFIKPENTKLCYCFDITQEQYINSFKNKSSARIKNFIVEKTKVGDCACEVRNPSGRCCLADFKQLENMMVKT